MTDLTAAVEAAARAMGEHRALRGETACSCGWSVTRMDSTGTYASHTAEDVLAAAAPILRAQVLAEAREAVAAETLVDGTDHPADVAYNSAIGHALAAIDALGAEGTR